MIYAGIGSRATPPDILAEMQSIAIQLADQGWLLRSGGADGADKAFEFGCGMAGGRKEIWLPWKGFNGSQSPFYLSSLDIATRDRAYRTAQSIHPNWLACNDAAKLLHMRNVLQVLGRDFLTPVEKVICWTPNGETIGGTATAIRLAERQGIEVINLGAP